VSQLTAVALQRLARGTRGIICKTARNMRYAARLTKAVRTTDLDLLERLYRKATSGFNDVSVNLNGFGIGFAVPAPADQIFMDTAIQGGEFFTANRIRSLSFRVLPLYDKIASSNLFAQRLVRAARAGDQVRLRRLIAPHIRRNGLISATGDSKSIVLRIRVAGGAVYLHHFFVL
jgi:hypothetical protein